ncbi:MAG TPA: amidohydrolase family protein, partial [Burkholderiales bacterium]|nr:amidohydrolase family protein [Burkholderiales bacterium]
MSGADVLPPDARLRRPRRPLPPGTVDCHAHIFDRFDKYRFSSSKSIPRPCVRARPGSRCTPRSASRRAGPRQPLRLRQLDYRGFPAGSPGALCRGGSNLSEHPGKRVTTFKSIWFPCGPSDGPVATGATTADLEAIARRVAPHGWHIEINVARSADWVELEPRLRHCPVALVFDHLGRVRGGEGLNAPGFKVVRRLLADRDDCWTKISSWYRLSDGGAPDFADMRPLVQALLTERPDRCVWGTNWPHPGMMKFM